jgi:hypothetical protein
MVRITTRNQKSGQRLGHPHSFGFGPMAVKVSQRGTYLPAALHRPGELPRSSPQLVSFIVDPSTVLGRRVQSVLRTDASRTGAQE